MSTLKRRRSENAEIDLLCSELEGSVGREDHIVTQRLRDLVDAIDPTDSSYEVRDPTAAPAMLLRGPTGGRAARWARSDACARLQFPPPPHHPPPPPPAAGTEAHRQRQPGQRADEAAGGGRRVCQGEAPACSCCRCSRRLGLRLRALRAEAAGRDCAGHRRADRPLQRRPPPLERPEEDHHHGGGGEGVCDWAAAAQGMQGCLGALGGGARLHWARVLWGRPSPTPRQTDNTPPCMQASLNPIQSFVAETDGLIG
jgi:hypothetical protein